jgi:NAD(P)-dependent dehydrogenase (short-subunit alcohol dehydrogenase family)
VITTTTGLLTDKVVLVTGASTGIGADAARVFAREGATVLLAARNESLLDQVTNSILGNGGTASWVRADVSNAADVDRLAASVIDRYGRLDAAFNNAGISEGGAALADLDEERFDRLLAVNLKGVWLCMRAEIRTKLAHGKGGSIVNTSSVGGRRGRRRPQHLLGHQTRRAWAEPDWRDVSDEQPLAGYLNAVAEAVDGPRNLHLVRLAHTLARRGERVFVVCGASHAMQIESALRWRHRNRAAS